MDTPLPRARQGVNGESVLRVDSSDRHTGLAPYTSHRSQQLKQCYIAVPGIGFVYTEQIHINLLVCSPADAAPGFPPSLPRLFVSLQLLTSPATRANTLLFWLVQLDAAVKRHA